jgi:hypothetical protein
MCHLHQRSQQLELRQQLLLLQHDSFHLLRRQLALATMTLHWRARYLAAGQAHAHEKCYHAAFVLQGHPADEMHWTRHHQGLIRDPMGCRTHRQHGCPEHHRQQQRAAWRGQHHCLREANQAASVHAGAACERELSAPRRRQGRTHHQLTWIPRQETWCRTHSGLPYSHLRPSALIAQQQQQRQQERLQSHAVLMPSCFQLAAEPRQRVEPGRAGVGKSLASRCANPHQRRLLAQQLAHRYSQLLSAARRPSPGRLQQAPLLQQRCCRHQHLPGPSLLRLGCLVGPAAACRSEDRQRHDQRCCYLQAAAK